MKFAKGTYYGFVFGTLIGGVFGALAKWVRPYEPPNPTLRNVLDISGTAFVAALIIGTAVWGWLLMRKWKREDAKHRDAVASVLTRVRRGPDNTNQREVN